eukprot:CAMPEP_0198501512 /NCGR_PEP_ID=MMETSP1462-20131121/8761_1 /TAXON_ID=1333877 /ORGANISM="Brandtodinium nutriculum, Strain RCC3387" /LENGTH=95 /DNA_ID=CAMNT_0044230561 /DNA_START=119 /DNA_END=403 /DNA_ORIENTATION=+
METLAALRTQHPSSRAEHTHAASLFDFGLRLFGEVPRLDDDSLLGQLALARNLHVPGFQDVDDWGFVGVLLVIRASLLGHQRPQALDVDGGDDLA